ncbi:MAG: helix-turn-helix domain-containing protein [Planctomycetaceae bacterium]|nr:helix-turn-helix domain-containing protein [Planctomycetaceae bacterium]
MTSALQRPVPLSLADRMALSKAEAARSVSVSTRLLELEVAAGRLRVAKVGRRWLVRPADLSAWLDARSR